MDHRKRDRVEERLILGIEGQLIKTFVSYPVPGRPLGIGLEGLPAQRDVDRVPDLLQGQTARRATAGTGCEGATSGRARPACPLAPVVTFLVLPGRLAGDFATGLDF